TGSSARSSTSREQLAWSSLPKHQVSTLMGERPRSRSLDCGEVMLGAHPHDHSSYARTDIDWPTNPKKYQK
ncbi:hypothetical protein, partial [Nocardiopsis alba]|uniref:hypothetical protein n=1 Tax=Nocardiopsis alba TaxID=53437 RepID=UPI0036C0DFC1